MTAPPADELGVGGFSFADLHKPGRLRNLHDLFCAEVERADPALWREWDAYRRAHDAAPSPIAVSSLLVRMAPFVSEFVTRLFRIQA